MNRGRFSLGSVALLVILLTAGCSTTSTLTMPTGEVYVYRGPNNEKVWLKKGKTELTFDRKKGPGIFEQLMGLWAVKKIDD